MNIGQDAFTKEVTAMGKKKTMPEPDEDDAFDDEEAPDDEDLEDDNVFEEEDMEEERDEEEAVCEDEEEEIEESSAPDDGAFVWVREPDHSREGRRGPKRGGEKRHTHHPSWGHPSNR